MKKYSIKTILVPVDFSETSTMAQQTAVDIALKTKSKLVLIHVVEAVNPLSPQEMISLGLVNRQMIHASNESLKAMKDELKDRYKLKAEYKSFCGNVYENIVRSAHLFNADLIVMGTHGTSGIKEWLFGSNAFNIVNNTTIPVLTINQYCESGSIKRIVFPFNENLLSVKKTDQVIFLARIFNASVLLLGFSKGESDQVVDKLNQKAKELTLEFASAGVENSFSVINGDDYAEEIMKFADKANADMISIITSRSHSADQILKSRPDKKLVNRSLFPVLSVPVE